MIKSFNFKYASTWTLTRLLAYKKQLELLEESDSDELNLLKNIIRRKENEGRNYIKI